MTISFLSASISGSVLTDGISEGGIVLLSRIVREVYAAAVSIAKLLVLTVGVVDALYLESSAGFHVQKNAEEFGSYSC